MGSIIEAFARPRTRALEAWRRAPMPGTGAVRSRAMRGEDFAAVLAVQRVAHTEVASPRQLESRRNIFPEGQVVAVSGGEVVGALASLVVDWDEPTLCRRWTELTGDGMFTSHDASAATLLVALVAADPDRGVHGSLRALYLAARRLARKLNLRRVVAAVDLEVAEADPPMREAAWGIADDPRLRVPMAQGFQYAGALEGEARPLRALLVWVNPLYSDGPPGDAARQCA